MRLFEINQQHEVKFVTGPQLEQIINRDAHKDNYAVYDRLKYLNI